MTDIPIEDQRVAVVQDYNYYARWLKNRKNMLLYPVTDDHRDEIYKEITHAEERLEFLGKLANKLTAEVFGDLVDKC